jgi:HSP20 family protein
MIKGRKVNDGDGEDASKDAGVGLGGLLQSLGGFLDIVSKLTDDEGREIRRSGEISGGPKGAKAVYGFTIRTGGPGKPQIEPFGNVIKKGSKGPVPSEDREPMVDIFDEEDHLLIVAEMPGVEERDIKFNVDGETLSLSARRGDHRYAKELELSASVTMDGAKSAFRNGVLEIELKKKTGG